MTTFLDQVIQDAKKDTKTIILPESDDERTLCAAETILAEGIADIILIGDEAAITASGHNLKGAKFANPRHSDQTEKLAELLYDLRKAKGMTREEAKEKVLDPVWFGILMVKAGLADGLVSGACHPTVDILSPSLKILKTAPGASMVSSFFIMKVPDCDYGDRGLFVFADPALVIQPTVEELAEIAIATAHSYADLIGDKPLVAMLSHSTYGSAKNPDAEKVVEATKLAQKKAPDLVIDGELQADAAIVESIGRAKAPSSMVAGRANVLIFPDLDAANIAYKLVQRLAKAEAYGPILQGIAAPVNDLSRGCSAEDIVGVVAITAIQAQAASKRKA